MERKNYELEKRLMSEEQTKKLEYILSLKENPPIDGIEIKIDWEKICNKYYLTDLFVSHHRTEIDWSVLCKNDKIPPSIIKDEGYAKYIDWDILLKYHKYDEQFLEKYIDYINWDIVSEYQDLSNTFIRNHANDVNWGILLINEKISDILLYEYWYAIDWEQIIFKYKEKVNQAFLKKIFKRILDAEHTYWYHMGSASKIGYRYTRLDIISKFADLTKFLNEINGNTRKNEEE